ncbi:hypothetical protein [Rothia mucilaginosa]|uniref:Uncharacterized protein n=1 Tax=Rothia mucilaginosa TaxID=43675 RepID=A0A0K2RWP3_9MICC|nr:hypothetical protein [Rothia mucilaginosa]BAS19248.1 hypothetical protein RM6536_0001 [Rothia mucilaginosa]
MKITKFHTGIALTTSLLLAALTGCGRREHRLLLGFGFELGVRFGFLSELEEAHQLLREG